MFEGEAPLRRVGVVKRPNLPAVHAPAQSETAM